MNTPTMRPYYTSAQHSYGAGAQADKTMFQVLKEQVYLTDIPNYLMGEKAATPEGLDAEQDRLLEQLLTELGLSVKRRWK